MFFHISKTAQPNFPHNHQIGNFVVSLDEGWTHVTDSQNNDIWYKGYLDHAPLQQYAVQISEESIPSHCGNFCIIKITPTDVSLHTDQLRSFPIWYNYHQGLTNLRDIGALQHADGVVSVNSRLELTHKPFDPIGPIESTILSFDQVIDQIDAILTQKVQEFIAHNKLPLRVFLSGGVDTALLFSYVKKYTSDYELITHAYTEYDYFYLKNHGYLSKFWAYNQIHYWTDNCVLASGAPGDEFTCRNPVTVDQLLRAHGTSFIEVMSDPQFKSSLNYEFFNRGYVEKLSNITPKKFTLPQAIKNTCEYNINDWQHWHLGKTITWTPFRNIDIFKLTARLPLDQLKRQLMDSSIQLELIRRNDPNLLSVLSAQKNSLNYLENLADYLADFG